MQKVLIILILSLISIPVFAQDKALYMAPDGNVGIGEDSPTEKLEVDGNIKASGRIMDATGFVMPVGTILPYGGTTAPAGWLLCDGSEVSRDTYADLFAILGENFGAGDGSASFNVPDLRGQFLRGVDSGAGVDPDREDRAELNPGGNIGDNVGSKQGDDFKSHRHGVRGAKIAASGNQRTELWDGSGTLGNNTEYAGGNETRPKNVYVNFIIKY